MRIEQKYNCLGHFGFGSGISMTENRTAYCNGCALAKACWAAHRATCQINFPDLSKHIDEISKRSNGDLKIMVKNGYDPNHDVYTKAMMANMEDAARIATGSTPKDRGKYTLKFPFKD